MAHRTLIVARMDGDQAEAVAELFARSDSSDLPHLVGARRRTLFRFHGLYFHLVEAEQDITPSLYRVREHPLYHEVNEALKQHLRPYDPGWREPKDAMAEPFYTWQA